MSNNLGIKLNKQYGKVMKRFRKYETKRSKEDNNDFYLDDDEFTVSNLEDEDLQEKSCPLKSFVLKAKSIKFNKKACMFGLGVITGVIISNLLTKDK